MLRRILAGAARGAADGAARGRRMNTGVRDLMEGRAYRRGLSSQDDAALEVSRLRQVLRKSGPFPGSAG